MLSLAARARGSTAHRRRPGPLDGQGLIDRNQFGIVAGIDSDGRYRRSGIDRSLNGRIDRRAAGNVGSEHQPAFEKLHGPAHRRATIYFGALRFLNPISSKVLQHSVNSFKTGEHLSRARNVQFISEAERKSKHHRGVLPTRRGGMVKYGGICRGRFGYGTG